MYKYIFFDLDGTLTDSGKGITNAVRWSLDRMGIPVGDESRLHKVVGPPLEESYHEKYGLSGEDLAQAVSLYRVYYNEMGGAYENEVYTGIPELLASLKAAGKKVILATSKGETGVSKVLAHFDLRKYFDFVATAAPTERNTKTKVLLYALSECGITDLAECVMVGDRENDITAARNVGMDSIGVLYGYGNLEELKEAGATYIAASPEEVGKYLL